MGNNLDSLINVAPGIEEKSVTLPIVFDNQIHKMSVG